MRLWEFLRQTIDIVEIAVGFILVLLVKLLIVEFLVVEFAILTLYGVDWWDWFGMLGNSCFSG